MSNSKMLIDASHPEETRVVVLKGNRVEEFDFEAANKKQLRGNIYLAKVTRVEPSLQAAFIEYGGNRHGFLAFSEIHPDYYQIPVADRQALLDEEARAHRDEDDDGRGAERSERGARSDRGERQERGSARAERGDRSERGSGDGERSERNDRGDRNHRRSRRNRRDGTVSAMERRGPPDDSVSEPAFTVTDSEGNVSTASATTPFDAVADDGIDTVSTGEASTSYGDEAAADAALEAAVPIEPTVEPAADAHTFRQVPAAGVEVPEAFDAMSGSDAQGSEALGRVEQGDEVHAAAAETSTDAREGSDPSLADEQTASHVADTAEVGFAPATTPYPDSSGNAGTDHETGLDARHEAALGALDDAPSDGGSDDFQQPAPAESRRVEHDETHAADHEDEHVEQIGGDALEDVSPRPARLRRHYKIQEVIKRRQILLIQVVKEERGNKGAALTTYLSLAGRYSVLMPNTARGGGISRKITDGDDRRRLKAIAQELEVPEGMGVILRTAGAARSNIEVRRDFEYLLRMWESVRELTLKSSAPTLVYEEGSLIKRSIRDLYTKDVEDVLVAGEDGFAEARDFMRMLMPGNAQSVQLYRDPQPIFAKSGVEAQLDSMFSNHVTLKSGGYLVINQTEALVAIDVNSGRSTREHNIEDTALRTNLEAADEVARQLRLRDLAGLIVVDFIDMEEGRNNRAVERRIKEALKNDRARIQIGRISHFGLLEMSRQRIRTGVLEGSTAICPHCAGAGTVRSTASIALHVLRLLEDALIKDASHDLVVRSRNEVALYVLNQKRAKLVELEQRFRVTITVTADPTLTGMIYHAIERGEPATPAIAPAPRVDLVRVDSIAPIFDPESEGAEVEVSAYAEAEGAEVDLSDGENGDRDPSSAEAGDANRKRRRRRRRRGRERDGVGDVATDAALPYDDGLETVARTGGDSLTSPDAAPQAEVGAPADMAGFESGAADAVGGFGHTDHGSGAKEAETAAGAVLPVSGDEDAAGSVGDGGLLPEEAPRRRRTRRTAARIAEEAGRAVSAPSAAEKASPAPRRRRSSRSRDVEAAVQPAMVQPADFAAETAAADSADRAAGGSRSANRALGVDLPEQHAPMAPAETGQPSETGESSPEPRAPDMAAATQPSAMEPPTAPDPDRPKRSGWWQRAKASFGS